MGNISIWQLLIIAVIIVVLFGTQKLRSIGYDIGASIKGFKKAMSDDENKPDRYNQHADCTTNFVTNKQNDVKEYDSKHNDK